MRTVFYKALWGMTGPLDAQLDQIREAGYDGIETPLPTEDLLGFRRALNDRGLRYVAMLFVDHADDLARGLEQAIALDADLANVHAGRDWWDEPTTMRFWETCLTRVADAEIRTAFETHRGRILYHPQVALRAIRAFPDLRLTADYSHFTNVCESMLGDQAAAMEELHPRVMYVHARVGFEEGPQVPDPRAPEFERYVQTFEAWWDAIRTHAAARGEIEFPVDPEFGPPYYQWAMPHTGEPLADLWEVCLWMRDRLRDRWR